MLCMIHTRFPELLVAIAKRYSSTALQFLRHLFSFWNASVKKRKQGYHSPRDLGDDITSTAPSVDGEKGGEMEEDASTRRATTLYSVVGNVAPGHSLTTTLQPSAGSLNTVAVSAGDSYANLVRPNIPHYPPEQSRVQRYRMHCCNPPVRGSWRSCKTPNDLLVMLLFLDHPGFIERSLRNTQDNGQTDVSKWLTFCETFQKDVESVTLLATVLLTANVSFLAIQTVDSLNGLHTWPQRLSYMSLLSALGCILMGLAVRVPRCFTAYNDTYFQLMALVLGFPFELFLYSIVFFIAALIERFRLNAATLQIIAAAVVISLVIMCLFVYWLITEPLEEQQQKASSQRDAAVGDEEVAAGV
ncbi:hypothetical protein EDD17DRAFT_1674710 [Pisolithus thermaeus]|nr:hypothetical protein EV401DRAFT_2043156 [Pisolithus croceorrhizus]KAI6138141.1 hypothetical protein EDD17DRAFT_1674710 [Pisolithus thermaeus]